MVSNCQLFIQATRQTETEDRWAKQQTETDRQKNRQIVIQIGRHMSRQRKIPLKLFLNKDDESKAKYRNTDFYKCT